MRERVERRLGEITAEYQAGQAKLAELDAERAGIEQAQLRLGSLIEVLEDLLVAPEEEEADEVEGASPDTADGEVPIDDVATDADGGEAGGEASDEDGSSATQAPSYSGSWTLPGSES
jgi:hypothetical protein